MTAVADVGVRPQVLDVEGLRVGDDRGDLVHGVDLALAPGRSIGIVGESGSGKTLTAMAVAGLLPAGLRTTGGRIRVEGADVTDRSPATAQALLRDAFGVVFQNPAVSLNPRLTIAAQLREALPREVRADRALARRRSVELLERVGVDRPLDRLAAYPHELSGGLNQRVVIAAAIARRPRVLVADEATTALDVSVAKQVLDLVDDLRRELDMALVLISHDIGIVADRCDDVLVLAHGRQVEAGPTGAVLRAPRAAHTRDLLAALPRADDPVPPPLPDDRPAVLRTTGVVREFEVPGRREARLRAVDGVDLVLRRGEALGLVGESGSGKTTLARILVGLDRPGDGTLHAFGAPVSGRTVPARRRLLTGVQYVFQDPWSALDPRQTIAEIVAEPIELAGAPALRARRRAAVADLLDDVGLPPEVVHRRPHQLSGGQRQRVVIARALALEPQVLVADEPVAALDVTVRARILDLLADLRVRRELSYVVISHDLAVVRRLCHRTLVMRAGRIVESGPTERIFSAPRHPYTRLLLDAVPVNPANPANPDHSDQPSGRTGQAQPATHESE